MINLAASFEDIIQVWLAEERAVGVCLLFYLVRLTTGMKAGIRICINAFYWTPMVSQSWSVNRFGREGEEIIGSPKLWVNTLNFSGK